ncbi:MAG: RNA polymerase sigma factor [Bryobacterales bacterium]|nr:RNA polymerase sigma factor [Bryobacterales bacterium]
MSVDSRNVLAEATSALSDEDIVARVLSGEVPLFELLVRRHNQRLYRATKAILKDEEEAEDAMQEAYVRAFVRLDQFAGEARFSTWLTKIAVHEALGRLRRRKRQEEFPDTMKSHDNPERTVHDLRVRAAIEHAVEKLPPIYRAVFVLRDVEELSGAETAECLGITEETVKTRLHRARMLLRRRLERVIGSELGRSFSYGARRCDAMTAAVMARIQVLSAGRSE